jgi:hypothetical protein
MTLACEPGKRMHEAEYRLRARVLLLTFDHRDYLHQRVSPVNLNIREIMATRLHAHLPAPAPHAAFSMPQTKSHVLAGVQDAYWSDDEPVSEISNFVYN